MSYLPSSSSSTHDSMPVYREHASTQPSRHGRRASRSSSPLSPSAYMVGTMPPLPPASSSTSRIPVAPLPHQPQQAHDPIRVQYDEISAMFGGARPGRPSQSSSRTQTTHSSVRSGGESTVPPPYDSRSEIESLPTYTKESDYDCELNRKLFLFGFLFFPLWIVGVIAPFVKPHRDPAKDNRTKEAQEEEDANMRALEMRWAWRCGFALITFIILVIIAVVVGVSVTKNH